MTTLRTQLCLTACLAALAVAGPLAAAECPAGFPSKPVKMVVGFGAGGGTDAIGRAIAKAIEEQQGWTVVVDNVTGAGGGVMAASLKVAAPDGLTIGVAGTDTVAIVPYTSPDATFRWNDFSYLGSAMQINYGLVGLTSRPYTNLEEFIAWAKEKGRATISVGGTNQEVFVTQLGKHYGVDLVAVPGAGAADAIQAVLGGHVDASTQGTQHIQQIEAGALRQLATLIDKRVDYAPEAKTLAESGLDPSMAILAYTILIAPKDLPADIATCLAGAVDEAVNSETYGELMRNFDNVAVNLGPDALTAVVEQGAAIYEQALKTN